ncbi:RNA-binding cell elongation regulator Jag/EloR [Limosilactobacillus galli]|uniref:RNA-binding cell elongation regulator Jag/EloR n=1 Tax=Limosilactobacillus galli TaxID=2991834 RepID=UPI0024BBE1FB|nr:RNA-binding cell elongation regulator Jag/EloR [Limosilactobacillus galli]
MPIYTGKTIEEAKQAAGAALGVPVDQLTIKVLQEPRRGFLRIGRRPAQISAEPIAAHKPKAAKEVKTPASSAPVKSAAAQAPAKPAVAAGDDLDPAVIKARHAANLKKVRTAGDQLVEYLQEIFKNLGIGTVPTITAVEAHAITVDIKSPEPGRVIGRHGQRINALEQLSNVFMNYHGAPKTVVMLDTSNYRERRRQTLHELAQHAETEVVASGQAVFLDPMPARERKQLHKELEDNPHVKTYSHGREPYRSVVVAPQN